MITAPAMIAKAALLLLLTFDGLFAGISEYPAGSGLAYCAEDARRVRRALGGGIALTDSAATLSNIEGAFRSFGGSDEDLFIFYFSGHGEKERLVAFDEEISVKRLRSLLSALPHRRKIILIDACFSGSFTALGDSRTFVMTSAAADQEANVLYLLRSSGAFSHALLDALTRDDRISVRELARRISDAVPRYCAECGLLNSAGRTQCDFDGARLGVMRPTAGGVIPDITLIRATDAPAMTRDLPARCSSADEETACRGNSELCPCPDFGDCEMNTCSSPAVCRTDHDRAICEKSAKDCPCSEYGECDMASCRN